MFSPFLDILLLCQHGHSLSIYRVNQTCYKLTWVFNFLQNVHKVLRFFLKFLDAVGLFEIGDYFLEKIDCVKSELVVKIVLQRTFLKFDVLDYWELLFSLMY